MVGSYILSVVCAALIVGILLSIIGKSSTTGKLLQMVGGLFLTIVAVQPVVDFDFRNITSFFSDFTFEAEAAAQKGTQIAADERNRIIKTECEAYILDKARLYGFEPQVTVTIGIDDVPVPVAVEIVGQIDESIRKGLQKMIEADLGISKENQTWISKP